MPIMERLVYMRAHPILGRLAREIMLVYGLDVPPSVSVGNNLMLQHRGMGTVIHPYTLIGKNVTLYHQVTMGRGNAHIPHGQCAQCLIVVEDDVTIFPGAKILATGKLTIGRGTIVGANAVLLRSTGENEVWAGSPARKIGDLS